MRAVSQIIRSSQQSVPFAQAIPKTNAGIAGLLSPSINTPHTARQYASGVKGRFWNVAYLTICTIIAFQFYDESTFDSVTERNRVVIINGN